MKLRSRTLLLGLLAIGAMGAVLFIGGILSRGGRTFDTWQRVADMPEPRFDYAAARLPDGRVLVAGGTGILQPIPPLVHSSVIFDPASRTWSPTGSPNVARQGAALVALASGQVLMAGGAVPGETYHEALDSCELFDPETGEWRLTGDLNIPRTNVPLTLLQDGRVLVVGGANGPPDGERFLDSAEIFEPRTQTWRLLENRLSIARESHFAVSLPDGRVLIGGGEGPWRVSGPVTELFDPATESFATAASLNQARWYPSVTLLSDGRVLVVGGWSEDGPDTEKIYLASAEIYDPARGVWEMVSPAHVARAKHIAVPLSGGRVAIAGGQDANGILSSVEVYDPVQDAWIQLEDMPLGVIQRTTGAVSLPEGAFLVAGGISEEPDSSEWYISATSYVFSPPGR